MFPNFIGLSVLFPISSVQLIAIYFIFYHLSSQEEEKAKGKGKDKKGGDKKGKGKDKAKDKKEKKGKKGKAEEVSSILYLGYNC